MVCWKFYRVNLNSLMFVLLSYHRTRGCWGVPDLFLSGLCKAPTQTVNCSAWEQICQGICIPVFSLPESSVFLLCCTEQFITYQETVCLMLTRIIFKKSCITWMKLKLQCATDQGNPKCSKKLKDWDFPKTSLMCPGFTVVR